MVYHLLQEAQYEEGVASLLSDAGPQSSRQKTIPGEKKHKRCLI